MTALADLGNRVRGFPGDWAGSLERLTMSAYMVDRDHIRYLVEFMLRGFPYNLGPFRWYFDGKWRTIERNDYARAAEVGQMLWDENLSSINARYPDTIGDPENIPGEIGERFIYDDHDPIPGRYRFDPVQVLKACHCYEYQSCEHEGWRTSEARAIIKRVMAAAVDMLPGYDDAAWGAPKLPEVCVRR